MIIFDAISAARARGIDIVLADTAGRLPTQLHLMEEIAKVRRVIQKAEPSGPHETLLVLDANFGQNALTQVRPSTRPSTLPASSSQNSTAPPRASSLPSPGVVPEPIRFVGVGEGIDDLHPFVARDFVDALFEQE